MDIRKLIFLAFILIFLNNSIFAGETFGRLVIHTGFLKSPTYTVNGQSEQPLYEGMEVHPKLESILSANPQALAEAKKAASYNGLSLVGNIVMLAGSVMSLSDTMQQKKDVDNGNLRSSSETNWTPLYVVGVGGIISVIANNLISKHWNKSINLYNKKISTDASYNKRNSDKIFMNFSVSPDENAQQWKLSGVMGYYF